MTSFQDLPDELRLQIFKQLSFPERRSILPLVCKDWQQVILRSPALWDTVNLDGAEEKKVREMLSGTAGWKGKCIPFRTAARWFRKYHTAHSFTAGGHFDVGHFEMHPDCLVVPLTTKMETLRHVEVDCISWVGGHRCFANMSWLANLEVLRLGYRSCSNPEQNPVYFSTCDLEDLANLRKLEELRFWSNVAPRCVRFEAFPESFYGLARLLRMELRQVDLTGLLEGLGALPALEHLEFIYCLGIKKALEAAPLPSSLRLLSLEGASIGHFLSAQQLRSLSGLVTLRMPGNSLSELPDLNDLKSLKVLVCSDNTFSELPVQQLLQLPAIEEVLFRDQRVSSFGVSGSVVAMESLVLI